MIFLGFSMVDAPVRGNPVRKISSPWRDKDRRESFVLAPVTVRARRDQSGGKGVNAMLSAVRMLLASTLTRKMMAAVVFALVEHLRERVGLPRFGGSPAFCVDLGRLRTAARAGLACLLPPNHTKYGRAQNRGRLSSSSSSVRCTDAPALIYCGVVSFSLRNPHEVRESHQIGASPSLCLRCEWPFAGLLKRTFAFDVFICVRRCVGLPPRPSARSTGLEPVDKAVENPKQDVRVPPRTSLEGHTGDTGAFSTPRWEGWPGAEARSVRKSLPTRGRRTGPHPARRRAPG
ncbi:hypothetical protein SAMN05443639_1132 [Stigmatella erecta]|uniref:Uncharacterized protein n=1 Tax=Stigmatella erecta TaxID=83460 RepID=A0A1I0KQC1_9BACT|nr:hypothetical protein SAMN05443639_1132 [Stigmatella erecta]